MSLFFFYNNRKPRQFGHKPILYDPAKDEMNERILKIKKEMGVIPEDEYQSSLKGEFVKASKHVTRKQLRESESGKTLTSRTFTLILILVLLLVVFYFLFLK